MLEIPVALKVDIKVPLDRFELKVQYEATHRVTGLFGVSGSGKTTWLETIAGLRKKAEGLIECCGEVWLDTAKGINVPAEKRGIGFVPQDHLLFPHLSVRGNLLFARKRAAQNSEGFQNLFNNVLEILELGALLDRNIDTLSGGERQRVALGRALCSGPKLLILDEPLASLDNNLRHRILPFLKRVRDAFDIPILIVSHNPIELQALCDEIVAIREGRVIATGEPIEVFTRPDLFGDAQSQGFRNIMPCVMNHSTQSSSVVRMGSDGSGPELRVPLCECMQGTSIFVDIAASEILVSRTKVQGVSARNLIPATIMSMRRIGHTLLLSASIREGIPIVAVEITADAMEELHLHEGDHCHLIIKSSSFTTYTTS